MGSLSLLTLRNALYQPLQQPVSPWGQGKEHDVRRGSLLLEPDRTGDYDLYVRPHYKVGMNSLPLEVLWITFLFHTVNFIIVLSFKPWCKSYQRCLLLWSSQKGFIWLLYLPLIS